MSLTRATRALGACLTLAAALALAPGCDSRRGSASPAVPQGQEEPPTLTGRVNSLLAAEWQVAGVSPAPLADDATFMRRAHLDITGVVPTEKAVRAFLGDQRKDKRARLIDELLASDAYARHWTNYWDEVLLPDMIKRRFVDRVAFRQWLHDEIKSGAGWDDMVRELLTASGVSSEGGRRSAEDMEPRDKAPEGINGAVNWILSGAQQPQNLAGAASRVFLGVQIQCAECHDHPTESWKQEDFKRFTAAFVRVDGRPLQREKMMGTVPFEVQDGDGNRRMKRRMKKKNGNKSGYDGLEPQALDGTSLEGESPRAKLADWMTAPENPWFARAIVNRMWGYFLGSGFVEPIDDFRSGQPVAAAAVLDTLAKDFAASGHDLRQLMRTICSTDAYARAARGPAALWSSFEMRPMNEVQLLDSLVSATGIEPVLEEVVGDKLPQLKLRLRRQFRFTFDVDETSTNDTFTGTVPQALMLLNGPVTSAGASLLEGSTLAAARDRKSEAATIESLYLATLSRKPSPEEVEHWQKFIVDSDGTRRTPVRGAGPVARLYRNKRVADATPKDAAYEDILWALLNSSEFFFIH